MGESLIMLLKRVRKWPVVIELLNIVFTPQDTKANTTYKGITCEVYYYEYTVGEKVNKYTMLIDQASGMPLVFAFIGYDDLFGSHYDEYVIEYDKVETTVDSSVFDIYHSKYCIS